MWRVVMTRKVTSTEFWANPQEFWGRFAAPAISASRCTDPVPAAPLEGTNPLKTRPNTPQSPIFTGFAKLARPLQYLIHTQFRGPWYRQAG